MDKMETKINDKLKSYFLIINLLIAILAFSYMISAQLPEDTQTFAPTTPLPTSQRGTVKLPEGSVSEAGELIGGASKVAEDIAKESAKPTIKEYLSKDLFDDFLIIAGWAGLGALVGSLAGGKDGEIWGAVSGLSGALTYSILTHFFGQGGTVFNIGSFAITPGIAGIGVALIVFTITYKQTSTQKVEFNCLSYEPPIGGDNCELCNDFEECSEYTCKSLGQACNIINKGTEQQKCIWINPQDVNSPIIDVKVLTSGLTTKPFSSVRPPATGIEIKPTSEGCIKAFTPLEFTITSDEPSQCKIDYNITTFEQMSYYVGGDNLFDYNHTEKLSLPGPDTINKIAPEILNDGIYTLYARCQDANGNKNENAYAIRFCVEPGPDLTAPVIVDTSIPSESPIQFDQTTLEIEVYVNEPAECKWSREDKDFNLMENAMECDTNLWEMNNEDTYTCRTTLEGIENRKDNSYFFRCKDQPGEGDSDRNTNTESFTYIIIGTQPLTILESESTGTIKGATDTIPVILKIETDNGYNNGDATCYYSLTEDEEDYIEFSETSSNLHEQRQDLPTGDYTYYFKCVDLGGNAVYNSTQFNVESDKQQPIIVRVYKESGNLKLITNERAECSYSLKNCNFEIDDGIQMTTSNFINHISNWETSKKFYIRCKDEYNNQPNPNVCSIVVRPWEFA